MQMFKILGYIPENCNYVIEGKSENHFYYIPEKWLEEERWGFKLFRPQNMVVCTKDIPCPF